MAFASNEGKLLRSLTDSLSKVEVGDNEFPLNEDITVRGGDTLVLHWVGYTTGGPVSFACSFILVNAFRKAVYEMCSQEDPVKWIHHSVPLFFKMAISLVNSY